MAFECPSCHAPALAIVDSVPLGPDDDDDERTFQRVRCGACNLIAAALDPRPFRNILDVARPLDAFTMRAV